MQPPVTEALKVLNTTIFTDFDAGDDRTQTTRAKALHGALAAVAQTANEQVEANLVSESELIRTFLAGWGEAVTDQALRSRIDAALKPSAPSRGDSGLVDNAELLRQTFVDVHAYFENTDGDNAIDALDQAWEVIRASLTARRLGDAHDWHDLPDCAGPGCL